MDRELEETKQRISGEAGIPVDQIASCPTAGEDGVANGFGIILFDADDPRKRPLAILLRERIGEPASVSKQS